MLAVMVRAEQQLPGAGEQDADECLGTTAVAPVRSSERFSGG